MIPQYKTGGRRAVGIASFTSPTHHPQLIFYCFNTKSLGQVLCIMSDGDDLCKNEFRRDNVQMVTIVIKWKQ